MEKKKSITAIIDRSVDDLYSVFTDGYGFMGFGDTAQEAIDDFYLAYEECKEFEEYASMPKDLTFNFVYDSSCMRQSKNHLSLQPEKV